MMKEDPKQIDLWNFTAQQDATFTNASMIEGKRMQRFNASSSGGPAFPTPSQIAKLRLILSTYQDGTGQLAAPNGMTLPGWRDFERAVAAAFEGQAQESKYVFDVIVPSQEVLDTYGISCKMRGELNKAVDRVNRSGLTVKGRISIELSNSAKYFWNQLKTRGINESNYRNKPEETGIALIELVKSWHDAV